MIPRQTLRRAYDQQAAGYDAAFTDQQAPKIRALAAALPASAGPRVDLGAGTGLVARITGRPVLAVDLSLGMLQRGPRPAVQADLRQLPFANATFAEVWCVTALIDEGPVAPALAEMARVLTPGGHLALSTLRRLDPPAVEAGLAAAGLSILDTFHIPPDLGWICQKLASR